MTILVGTDFSKPAAGAVLVAGALAARWGVPLRVVHVLRELGELEPGGEASAVYDPARVELAQAVLTARELGAEATETLTSGAPAKRIAEEAERIGARLVVTAWRGKRPPTRWGVGRVPDELARACPAPLLVVRDPEPLLAWLRGGPRLKVTAGSDLTSASDGAVGFVDQLRRAAACDVSFVHVAWPPGVYKRLGIDAPMDLEHLDPKIAGALERDLATQAGTLHGEGDVRYEVCQSFGRADHQIVALAEEAGADLLVVGTHQRSTIDRLWQGSVSRGVLHLATSSVACVPSASLALRDRPIPRLTRVLVAVDFSAPSARAVRYALSLLPHGGELALLHVTEPRMKKTPVSQLLPTQSVPSAEHRRQIEAAEARLQELVPPAAAERGVVTQILVTEGDAADEICAAADRLGADVVCVGTHGRAALPAALLGSVARAVLSRCDKPVLVVNAGAEAQHLR
jgi:nucleotide-binding universal stress UspA family protein